MCMFHINNVFGKLLKCRQVCRFCFENPFQFILSLWHQWPPTNCQSESQRTTFNKKFFIKCKFTATHNFFSLNTITAFQIYIFWRSRGYHVRYYRHNWRSFTWRRWDIYFNARKCCSYRNWKSIYCNSDHNGRLAAIR